MSLLNAYCLAGQDNRTRLCEGRPSLPENGVCLVKSFQDSTFIGDCLNPKLSYPQMTLERKVKVTSVN